MNLKAFTEGYILKTALDLKRFNPSPIKAHGYGGEVQVPQPIDNTGALKTAPAKATKSTKKKTANPLKTLPNNLGMSTKNKSLINSLGMGGSLGKNIGLH